MNQGIVTTCNKCGEAQEYKTIYSAQLNKEKCLFCRKYPTLEKVNNEWTVPCPHCKQRRPLISRRQAIYAITNNSLCNSCANKEHYDNQPDTFHKKLEESGIIRSLDRTYTVECRKCHKEHLFSSPGLAWDFFTGGYVNCYQCIARNREAIVNKDVVYNATEEWRIISYAPKYSVNNYGDVKNNKTNRVLKPYINKRTGYIQLILGWQYPKGKNKIPNIYYGHRLVADAFIPNTENKPEINHKNLNKSDNRLFNLEWVTKKENMNHARMLGARSDKTNKD